MTLRELMETDFGPEPAESAYRRGYADGLIMAQMAFEDVRLPGRQSAIRLDRALQRLLDFWQGRLNDWVRAGAGGEREEAPPIPRL